MNKDILEFQPCLVENPELHGLEPSLSELVAKYYKHHMDALTADVYIDRYMDAIHEQLKAQCPDHDFNGEVLGRVVTYLSQFEEFQPNGDNSSDQAFRNIAECIGKLKQKVPDTIEQKVEVAPQAINRAWLTFCDQRSTKQAFGDAVMSILKGK